MNSGKSTHSHDECHYNLKFGYAELSIQLGGFPSQRLFINLTMQVLLCAVSFQEKNVRIAGTNDAEWVC